MFGAYSCRPIDNEPGARLSEHAFGNAVDVAGFTLADGRTLTYVRDWKGAGTQEAAFLHEAHAGACQYFTTVLGPGADVFHYNHIHLDLANHGATNTGPRRICKPAPEPSLLPPPAAPDRPAARARRSRSRWTSPTWATRAPWRWLPRAPSRRRRSKARAPDPTAPCRRPSARPTPAPPVLPAGAGYSVDPTPTSSIADHDE